MGDAILSILLMAGIIYAIKFIGGGIELLIRKSRGEDVLGDKEKEPDQTSSDGGNDVENNDGKDM